MFCYYICSIGLHEILQISFVLFETPQKSEKALLMMEYAGELYLQVCPWWNHMTKWHRSCHITIYMPSTHFLCHTRGHPGSCRVRRQCQYLMMKPIDVRYILVYRWSRGALTLLLIWLKAKPSIWARCCLITGTWIETKHNLFQSVLRRTNTQ